MRKLFAILQIMLKRILLTTAVTVVVILAAFGFTLVSIQFINTNHQTTPNPDSSLINCPEMSLPYRRLGGFPISVYKYDECGQGIINYKHLLIDFSFWLIFCVAIVWLLNKYIRQKNH